MITKEFLREVLERIDAQLKPLEYSPLVLAYIGDTVYEVFVRTKVVAEGNATVNALHRKSIAYVKAKAQSDFLREIMDTLSEKEKDIVRRGRNAKAFTVPKNVELIDYKYATGLESLIGYLYLEKNFDRLFEIMGMAVGRNA